MWEWPPVRIPPASQLVLPDGTILTLGAIADGELLGRVGDEIVGVTPAPSGGVLLDWFFTRRTTAFTTTDTTSPGTECVSIDVDVPAGAVVEISASYAGANSGANNVRAELTIDGAKIAAETQTGTGISAGGVSYGNSMLWMGLPATGNHHYAVTIWTTAGTVTIDPTTSVVQHCEMTIKVFVDA